MTKKQQLMLAAVIALGFPAAAHAAPPRTWWVYDFERSECMLAAQSKPDYATPEAFHLALRDLGLIDEVQVKKDNNGNILIVEISTRFPGDTRDVTAHFFLSGAECRTFAAAAGTPNLEDLR